MDDCDSLLGGFVADRTRLCAIMFPEGDATTLDFDCAAVEVGPWSECVDSVGEDVFPSVGVGGVMKVLGASMRFGDAAGRFVVTMRLGADDRGDGLERVSPSMSICGGDTRTESSTGLASRFLAPKNDPIPPPLVLGLAVSVSPAATLGTIGLVAVLRLGANASLSFPTGDTALLFADKSLLLAGRSVPSSVETWEFTSVASAEWAESTVSEVMRGEERVKRPAWDWCGEMPGRFCGGGL
jgi:hypothetical protein